MRRLLDAVVHAEHKVVAGPRTLLMMALLFCVLLALGEAAADAATRSPQERWVRAALAAAGVLTVLVWAERDRPYREPRAAGVREPA